MKTAHVSKPKAMGWVHFLLLLFAGHERSRNGGRGSLRGADPTTGTATELTCRFYHIFLDAKLRHGAALPATPAGNESAFSSDQALTHFLRMGCVHYESTNNGIVGKACLTACSEYAHHRRKSQPLFVRRCLFPGTPIAPYSAHTDKGIPSPSCRPGNHPQRYTPYSLSQQSRSPHPKPSMSRAACPAITIVHEIC